MKHLLFLTIAMFLFGKLVAAPFENLPHTITQPDGTKINCFVSGDEFFNWIHDKEGYPIIKGNDSYYYYALHSGKSYIASTYKVGEIDPLIAGISNNIIVDQQLIQQRRKSLEVPSKSQIDSNKNRNELHTGTINNIVIYIRFAAEEEIATPRQEYDDRLNLTEEYSLKSYYWETSYNQLTINSTHYPPVEVPSTSNASYQDSHPRSYFQPYDENTNPNGYDGDYDRRTREHQLLVDAVEWVNANHAIPNDLNIDANNDGSVDNVCFMINGESGEWAELLWAHRWALYTYDVYINGKQVWDYTFQPENQVSVRTLSHEMFHVLGAPDLYHYYNYKNIKPAGKWDIMNSGSGHMLTYMKWKYAEQSWIPEIPEITTAGQYTLLPTTHPTNNCFKIASPNSSSEFFMVEYRKWEGEFESLLPAEGLIVYRVNPNFDGNAQFDGVTTFDEVYVYRPGGTLEENGDPDLSALSANSGNTSINDQTNPNSFLQDGTAGGLHIYDVSVIGDSITFRVSFGQTEGNLVVTAQPEVGGNPTGAGSYVIGSTIELIANPNENWEFIGWSSDQNEFLSSNETFSYVLNAESATIIALYQEIGGFDFETQKLELYPNPVYQSITIPDYTSVRKITIYNMVGQEEIVFYTNGTKQQIDLSSLSQGIYMVEVYKANNQKYVTKIVKK